MVGGRWTVVGGRWSVVGGRWSVVGGRRVARYRRERSQRDGEGMPSRAVTSELGDSIAVHWRAALAVQRLPLRVLGPRWLGRSEVESNGSEQRRKIWVAGRCDLPFQGHDSSGDLGEFPEIIQPFVDNFEHPLPIHLVVCMDG